MPQNELEEVLMDQTEDPKQKEDALSRLEEEQAKHATITVINTCLKVADR